MIACPVSEVNGAITGSQVVSMGCDRRHSGSSKYSPHQVYILRGDIQRNENDANNAQGSIFWIGTALFWCCSVRGVGRHCWFDCGNIAQPDGDADLGD